jgi:hypothetical protein
MCHRRARKRAISNRSTSKPRRAACTSASHSVLVYLLIYYRAIVDGRLGLSILEGVTIMAGFAVEQELKHWSKMRLPETMSLMRKIKEVESKKIGINVEFIELGFEGDANVAQPNQGHCYLDERPDQLRIVP